jgi:hypothetical protein
MKKLNSKLAITLASLNPFVTVHSLTRNYVSIANDKVMKDSCTYYTTTPKTLILTYCTKPSNQVFTVGDKLITLRLSIGKNQARKLRNYLNCNTYEEVVNVNRFLDRTGLRGTLQSFLEANKELTKSKLSEKLHVFLKPNPLYCNKVTISCGT